MDKASLKRIEKLKAAGGSKRKTAIHKKKIAESVTRTLRANKKIAIKNAKDSKVSPRKDWIGNQIILEQELLKYIAVNKKFPTTSELAELVGFSIGAVSKHLEAMDFAKLKARGIGRLLTPKILENIAARGLHCDKSAELHFQLTENFTKVLAIKTEEANIIRVVEGIMKAISEATMTDKNRATLMNKIKELISAELTTI